MQLFLGGTTAATTWRLELLARAEQQGIPASSFFDPHLRRKPGQTGPIFTPEFAAKEAQVKSNSKNLLLFYMRPGVVRPEDAVGLTPEQIVEKSHRVGQYTLFEIGEYAVSEPYRTAVVFDFELFGKDSRMHKLLGMVRDRLAERFGDGQPPYFPSLQAAEDWAFPQLKAAIRV